jgi:hypothetical protein
MTRITKALAMGLAVTLSACAGYSRVTEYPLHLPQNLTVVHITGGRVFTVKQHPRDSTILIEATIGRAALAGLAGPLFGSNTTAAGIEPQYREAAEKWAASRGCTVERLYQLESVAYEASLACPGGSIPR